ncbi:hypothetical protein KXW51_006159, partial [Aspergillus fumigatus]
MTFAFVARSMGAIGSPAFGYATLAKLSTQCIVASPFLRCAEMIARATAETSTASFRAMFPPTNPVRTKPRLARSGRHAATDESKSKGNNAMTTLFRTESHDPKTNAQRNLCGRTHYVDDDNLRFHKSRVISARVVDNGLLFAIVTSDALDFENRKRGFRYVIFDVFGT